MKYDPKDAKKTLPPGDYEAELLSCTDKVSKTGKEMLEVTWRLYPNDGHPPVQLRDWIVAPDSVWKLKKIAKAWGLESSFDDGSFNPADHLNSTLIVKLKVRHDDKYGEQNAIADYKPKEKTESGVVAPALREQMRRAMTDDTPVTPNFAPDGAVKDDCPF